MCFGDAFEMKIDDTNNVSWNYFKLPRPRRWPFKRSLQVKAGYVQSCAEMAKCEGVRIILILMTMKFNFTVL